MILWRKMLKHNFMVAKIIIIGPLVLYLTMHTITFGNVNTVKIPVCKKWKKQDRVCKLNFFVGSLSEQQVVHVVYK